MVKRDFPKEGVAERRVFLKLYLLKENNALKMMLGMMMLALGF